MKRVVVVGLLATLILWCAGISVALATGSANQWVVGLEALNPTTLDQTEGPCYLGVGNSAWGSPPVHVDLQDTNTSNAEVSAYDYPPPIGEPYSRSNVEIQPAPAPGATVTWNAQMFVASGYTASQVELIGWQPSKIGLTNEGLDPGPYSMVSLFLVNGTNMTYDPADSTLLWDIKAMNGVNSTSGNPAYSQTFSTVLYGSGPGSGASSAYHLQLVAAMAPEPGSMAAVLGGLAGILGYSIRRRR